jgi:hypothetical protein
VVLPVATQFPPIEKQLERSQERMTQDKSGRWFFKVGGICGILYPILDLSFFALYPLAAGGAILAGKGQEAYMARLAELGERPLVLSLEWAHTLLPLLLLPFALALYRLLSRGGQRNLALLALISLLLSLALTLPSNAMNATLNHDLGRSYLEATTEAERAAIFAAFRALGAWHGGLNQMASVLYLAFVGLGSAGLLLSRTHRVRGWLGIGGAIFALLKLTPVWPGMTNFLWSGVAYTVWPIAVGIGLLRQPLPIEGAEV